MSRESNVCSIYINIHYQKMQYLHAKTCGIIWQNRGGYHMAPEETKTNLIDQFTMLQEIKKANKEENAILDYKIKTVAAKLSSLGVNVEDLTL